MTHRRRYFFDEVKADNQVNVSASVRGFFKGTVGGIPAGFLPESVSPLLRGTRGVVDSRFSPVYMHPSHLAQASRSHGDATVVYDIVPCGEACETFFHRGDEEVHLSCSGRCSWLRRASCPCFDVSGLAFAARHRFWELME